MDPDGSSYFDAATTERPTRARTLDLNVARASAPDASWSAPLAIPAERVAVGDFPRARNVLWDDAVDGGREGARLEAHAAAPTIRLDARATEAAARAVLGGAGDASECEEEDGSYRVVRARRAGAVSGGVLALAGRDEDARGLVAVEATSEEDVEHFEALDERCFEIEVVLLPRDHIGDEYVTSSRLQTAAWENEDALRRAFHRACSSGETLCPAALCPMRAAATVVGDDASEYGTALRIAFAVDVPSCDFDLRPIYPPRCRDNETYVEARAASTNARSRGERRITTGFITLDRTRRVVFLRESARGTESEPLTGVWIQGPDTVQDAAAWAACARFACSELLVKLTQRGKFLCAILLAGSSDVLFYEVTATHSSSPFVPYGADIIVQPGAVAETKTTPVDEGVAPSYFHVAPEDYGAEHYGFVQDDGYEDGEAFTEEDIVEEDYGERDFTDDDEFEEEKRERAAQMELLQREIECLRDAIASTSFIEEADDDEDDEEAPEMYRRRSKEKLSASDDEDSDIRADVLRLARELELDIERSRALLASEKATMEEFDPKSMGYTLLATDERDAELREKTLREADEDLREILRLAAPSQLAVDHESELRAELRAEYGELPAVFAREVVPEEHFPRIAFNPDVAESDDDDSDDAIVQRYIDTYGQDNLLSALGR